MTTQFYFPRILCNANKTKKLLEKLALAIVPPDFSTGNKRHLVLLLVPSQNQGASPRKGRYQLNGCCPVLQQGTKLSHSALIPVRWQPEVCNFATSNLFHQSHQPDISRAEKYISI